MIVPAGEDQDTHTDDGAQKFIVILRQAPDEGGHRVRSPEAFLIGFGLDLERVAMEVDCGGEDQGLHAH